MTTEPIALSLPRASAITEALLRLAPVQVSADEFQVIRARLLDELPPLASELVEGERLTIGSRELAIARDDPEQCSSKPENFVPSPFRCRRGIGVSAVERCVRGRSSSPQTAVCEVIASGLQDLCSAADAEGSPRPPWWAEWYASLPAGGRAAVMAQAVTWATQLWSSLDWKQFGRPAVVGGRDDFWECPGVRRLLVRARADVRAFAGPVPVSVVVSTGFPGATWRADLAHRALVVGLARGERSIPCRVLGLWPSSGLARFCEVDSAALSEAATALVSAVATWVDAFIGARAGDRVAPGEARAPVLGSRGMEVFDDLEEEEGRLESILEGLDEASWLRESGAPGWTVADVVLHLAQSEEAVVASASAAAGGASARFDRGNEELDDTMDRLMRAERADPAVVFERWRKARREALETLRTTDPGRALAWAAAPLKPKVLATTRIAEHWAHGLDIVGPLGIPFPDTDRLRHVAWLAHRSLPYAFSLEGEPAKEVFCELLGPSGDTWTYGTEDAPSSIRGSAGSFCRVGARRLAPDASGLETAGPFGASALLLLRNYAA